MVTPIQKIKTDYHISIFSSEKYNTLLNFKRIKEEKLYKNYIKQIVPIHKKSFYNETERG